LDAHAKQHDLRAQCRAWTNWSSTATQTLPSVASDWSAANRFDWSLTRAPNQAGRIVSAELIEMDGKPVSACLTTLELRPDGESTQLKSTSQIVSFVGSEMIGNHQIGNDGALDNLVRHFTGQTPSPTAGDTEFPQP
jgi:hypothetical protein